MKNNLVFRWSGITILSIMSLIGNSPNPPFHIFLYFVSLAILSLVCFWADSKLMYFPVDGLNEKEINNYG